MSELTAPSTLSESLEWANTRLAAGDAIEALPAVKGDSDVPMRTMGSVSLVRNLAAAGLVDRLRLMVFPLTCGSAGRERIFGEGKLEHFELEQTRVLDARVVCSSTGRPTRTARSPRVGRAGRPFGAPYPRRHPQRGTRDRATLPEQGLTMTNADLGLLLIGPPRRCRLTSAGRAAPCNRAS
jgi:hypothetical protein